MSINANRTKLGELRPSQLLYTYGVGAIIDLPNISAMVMGLEDWEQAYCNTITEDRLLRAVKEELGEQAERLVSPPMPPETLGLRTALDESNRIGVPVAPFPRYMRCPRCGFLGPLNSGVFTLRIDPYHPDKTRYEHHTCQGGQRAPTALPARFLVACENGHLDDFPWLDFVHKGPSSCRAMLKLYEVGASGEAVDVEVKCTVCDSTRRLAEAFGEQGRSNMPACRGRRPHLKDFEEPKEGGSRCDKKMKAILLGASNSWFGVTLSALSLPISKDPLHQLTEEHWGVLKDVARASDLAMLRRMGLLVAALAQHDDNKIMEAINKRRSGQSEEPHDAKNLKAPEWKLFSNPDPSLNGADFRLREVAPPKRYSSYLDKVVLVERLREVTALLGFTRILSPGEFAEEGNLPHKKRAPLSRNPSKFVPASEVRGEGIFISFREYVLSKWVSSSGKLDEEFLEAHQRWRRARNLEPPEAGYPGIRYLLLHSFSHALMRQLSLECGYSAASIRERIYAQEPDLTGSAMAGILLYTAATDSEGTLGGLVGLGEPDLLGHHIEQALEQITLCASDPLCAEHRPDSDGTSLHGAACHACLFAPETSCELGNRYLDRSALVETVSKLQFSLEHANIMYGDAGGK